MNLPQITAENAKLTQNGVSEVVDAAFAAEIVRRIKSLVPGQTLQGEIINRSGSDCLLRLAGDIMLNARVDQNINLEPGQLFTFEVRSTGKTVSLYPLFTNTSADVNVIKALEMAELPVNDSSIAMTEKMMEAGMPVKREVLRQVFREVTRFPQTDPKNIVDLHKLKLPVTQANIEQMENYRSYNHQLNTGMNQLLDSLPDVLKEIIFRDNAPEENLQQAEQLLKVILLPNAEEGEAAPQTDVALRQNPVSEAQVLSVQQGEEKSDRVVMRGDVADSINPSELVKKLLDILKEAVNSESYEAFKHVPEDSEFKMLLSLGIKQQWLLKPEELPEPDRVREQYRRLTEQVRNIADKLDVMGQRHSEAFKTVSNLSHNLDFMNQINQTYTYFQLPLQLGQKEAHGDFYVFTNKRSLAEKDGNISALLHLDMEHLGPLDVYVTMQTDKVSTSFYVADDEVLDFIEAHMDLLTSRLQRRGYDCNCAVSVRTKNTGDEKRGALAPILNRENSILITHNSFDVRT